jgi:acyl carrier protein
MRRTNVKTTYSEEEIFVAVETAIRTVLNPKGHDILPATKLTGELGAESIDFIDISCELEKQLDVELDFRKLSQERKAKTNGAAVDITVQDIIDHLKA